MWSSDFTSADAFLVGPRLWEPEAAGAKLHDRWHHGLKAEHRAIAELTNGELATSHGVTGHSVSIKQHVDSLAAKSLECAREEHSLHGQGCVDKHIKKC